MRIIDNLLILAGVALVLSLIFLVIILLTNQLGVPLIGGSALDVVKRNVMLGQQIFIVALWAVVLLSMVRHYRVDSLGYLIALGGAACWLLLPMLVKSRAPATAAVELQQVGQLLVDKFQASGAAIAVVGVLRVTVGRIASLTLRPQSATAYRIRGASAIAEIAEERAKARPSLMRKCWELHYCRGSLRVTCPRFLEGTSCWRKRSGCYCDQDLATRLLSTMAAKVRLQVAEELESAQTRARTHQRRMAAKRRKKTPRPCGECPLYLDHQKYKYRVLAWLSYPVAAVIIALSLPFIRSGYDWLEWEAARYLEQMQVLPHALTDAPLEQAPWMSAENAIVLMLGVLVVAVVLQLTEVAIFRLKW
jgi:hypothetical protein